MQTNPLLDFLLSNRIHSLKYLRSTTLGSKDIEKYKFVTTTQCIESSDFIRPVKYKNG